ncbi:methyl-accepting chemotaxis protein [uncultured Aureimonas sp.]|uniref:methyl-accepting chemotaxis protein n=1 Tax=uncultured Aureimonas sp. TaxID=1604662 RepID=UPI0025F393B8|nr:methyl-accepting chemotaxis protein [uncultured Aureimonas sp.]
MFRSASIATKISGLAVALMVIAAAIALAGFIGLRDLNPSMDDYATFSAATLDGVLIERDFVLLRARSFNFVVTGDQEDGARTSRYIEEMPAAISRLVAENGGSSLAPAAGAVASRFGAYLTALRDVVGLRATAGPEAALAAYQSRIDGLAREVSPLFTELRQKRLALLGDIRERAAASYGRSLSLIISVAVAGLCLGALLAVLVARSINRPLNRMTEAMTRLSAGETEVDVPAATGNDEISRMARAVGVFADNAETLSAMTRAEQATQEIGEVIRRAAAGDLTVRVGLAEQSGFLLQIGEAVNRLLESTNRTFQSFAEKARSTAVPVAEASAAVGQVSDGARAQNAQLGEVAGALGETTSAIGEVSGGTRLASDKAVAAADAVERGLQSVENLTAIMQSIGQNGRKVSQLTQVIGEIANRTHILSLNAAIEAARAGEHGKGFVVVAQEVGKLAESAGQNAKQIAEIVEQATLDTAAGRTATDEVKATMATISDGTTQTKAVIHSVAVAIEEQQATLRRIDANVSELRTIAASNSTAAEEISMTMVHLAGLADETRTEVGRFRTA